MPGPSRIPPKPSPPSKHGDVLLKIRYYDEGYADWFDRWTGLQDVAIMAQSHYKTGSGYFVLKGLRDEIRYDHGAILFDGDLHDGDVLRLVKNERCKTCNAWIEVPQTDEEKMESKVRYTKGKYYCTQPHARKDGEFFIPDPVDTSC